MKLEIFTNSKRKVMADSVQCSFTNNCKRNWCSHYKVHSRR